MTLWMKSRGRGIKARDTILSSSMCFIIFPACCFSSALTRHYTLYTGCCDKLTLYTPPPLPTSPLCNPPNSLSLSHFNSPTLFILSHPLLQFQHHCPIQCRIVIEGYNDAINDFMENCKSHFLIWMKQKIAFFISLSVISFSILFTLHVINIYFRIMKKKRRNIIYYYLSRWKFIF